MLRMKNDINTLLACRELSALHDSVTGLYNEYGLIHGLKLAAEVSEPKDSVIIIMVKPSVLTEKSIFKGAKTHLEIDIDISEGLQGQYMVAWQEDDLYLQLFHIHYFQEA